MMLALSVGFEADKVVYDSPCKTLAEIRYSLEKNVHLNIDNLQELQRIQDLVKVNPKLLENRTGPIGIRVNPLVGAGTIAALSVATGKSKFGVPLPKEGDEHKAVLEAVLQAPWINCVHVHTGSGCMGLNQLVLGIRTAVDFAMEVNEKAGERRISVIDMGGGLSVDFQAMNKESKFDEYANALREAVPELFDGKTFDRVVTEFGAAFQSKFAWLASRVEYTKTYDGGRIALIHAGSDLFMRACYAPAMIKHRVSAHDPSGALKDPASSPVVPTDIAGPLCFAGDVVVKDAQLPSLEVDDIVVISDTGGNTLSIRTSHCSRQRPAVYVYRMKGMEVEFTLIQSQQKVSDTLEQWRCLPESLGSGSS